MKYGDGEFNAANYHGGKNCDGTPYTKKLGDMLKESFVYNSLQANSMIGAWHDSSTRAFWEGLGNPNVKWVDYHTVLLDVNEPTAPEAATPVRAFVRLGVTVPRAPVAATPVRAFVRLGVTVPLLPAA